MKKRILVVDDDEGLRDLYEETLVEEGYDVLTAANGKEALQMLDEEKPDLVVLDIIMPKMDGMEALGRILGKYKKVPVILHSSHPQYQEDFMSWAADAYLLKSTDLSELKEKIREFVEERKPGPRLSQKGTEGRRTNVEGEKLGKR